MSQSHTGNEAEQDNLIQPTTVNDFASHFDSIQKNNENANAEDKVFVNFIQDVSCHTENGLLEASNLAMSLKEEGDAEISKHNTETFRNGMDPSIYLDEDTMHVNSDNVFDGVLNQSEIKSPVDRGDVSSPFSAMESDGMETGFDDGGILSAPSNRKDSLLGSTPLASTTPGISSSGSDPEMSSSSRKKRRRTRREMPSGPFHRNFLFNDNATTCLSQPALDDILDSSTQNSFSQSQSENFFVPQTLTNVIAQRDSAVNLASGEKISSGIENISVNGFQNQLEHYQNLPGKVIKQEPNSDNEIACRNLTHTTVSTLSVLKRLRPLSVAYPSSNNGIELKIISQPETRHRARYRTEGSRGPVKDSSQQGYPKIGLLGQEITENLLLEVFVGAETGKPVKPHGFYQACKVTGRSTTPCEEVEIEGTKVIQIPFQAGDPVLSVDCVGILKLRNADVEARVGKAKKRSQTARLVFRVELPSVEGKDPVVLQITSVKINCTQPPGPPEILKKSCDRCSVEGNMEVFIIGKNFHRGTKVVFQDPEENDGSHWSKEGEIDKDSFHQTHMVVKVPPYHDMNIKKPVSVQMLVNYQGRRCEPHSFIYTPITRSDQPDNVNSPMSLNDQPITLPDSQVPVESNPDSTMTGASQPTSMEPSAAGKALPPGVDNNANIVNLLSSLLNSLKGTDSGQSDFSPLLQNTLLQAVGVNKVIATKPESQSNHATPQPTPQWQPQPKNTQVHTTPIAPASFNPGANNNVQNVSQQSMVQSPPAQMQSIASNSQAVHQIVQPAVHQPAMNPVIQQPTCPAQISFSQQQNQPTQFVQLRNSVSVNTSATQFLQSQQNNLITSTPTFIVSKNTWPQQTPAVAPSPVSIVLPTFSSNAPPNFNFGVQSALRHENTSMSSATSSAFQPTVFSTPSTNNVPIVTTQQLLQHNVVHNASQSTPALNVTPIKTEAIVTNKPAELWTQQPKFNNNEQTKTFENVPSTLDMFRTINTDALKLSFDSNSGNNTSFSVGQKPSPVLSNTTTPPTTNDQVVFSSTSTGQTQQNFHVPVSSFNSVQQSNELSMPSIPMEDAKPSMVFNFNPNSKPVETLTSLEQKNVPHSVFQQNTEPLMTSPQSREDMNNPQLTIHQSQMMQQIPLEHYRLQPQQELAPVNLNQQNMVAFTLMQTDNTQSKPQQQQQKQQNEKSASQTFTNPKRSGENLSQQTSQPVSASLNQSGNYEQPQPQDMVMESRNNGIVPIQYNSGFAQEESMQTISESIIFNSQQNNKNIQQAPMIVEETSKTSFMQEEQPRRFEANSPNAMETDSQQHTQSPHVVHQMPEHINNDNPINNSPQFSNNLTQEQNQNTESFSMENLDRLLQTIDGTENFGNISGEDVQQHLN